MGEHCLDCHEEVAFLQERGRGLHGRPGHAECAKCHPEHAGAGFDLIQWKEGSAASFEHAGAGWPLEGSHASLACGKCHQARFRKSPAAGLGPRRGSSRGWIGLDGACGTCHEDTHRGALGEECSACHGPAAWKPAASFDHSRAAFAVTGKHEGLACAKCHLAPGLALSRDARGRPVPLYKPLPHAECSACHADPHQGHLGAACSTCHRASAGFKEVSKAAFDHRLTRYPLRGSHRNASCQGCHGAGAGRKARPRFDRCGSCHEDPHAGTATLAGKPADCGSCHSVEGWKRASFTVARHASTPYPLRGRHAEAACESCHRKDPGRPAAIGKAGVLIRPAHERCADCHAGAHGGQLAARPGGAGACEGCHAVDGWKPARFSVEEHRATRFPLEGAHAAAACSSCHGRTRPGLPPPREGDLGKAGIAFRLEEKRCVECHLDPHAGRLAGSCGDCHGIESFRPSTVDTGAHRRFSFPLEGAHRAIACVDCHEALKAAPARSSLVLATGDRPKLLFDRARSRCEDCHRGPHGDQFAGAPAKGCDLCHGVDAFLPASRFDHDRDAAFTLKGAHARVACGRCHEARTEDGHARVAYRAVPARCEACHVSVPSATKARS